MSALAVAGPASLSALSSSRRAFLGAAAAPARLLQARQGGASRLWSSTGVTGRGFKSASAMGLPSWFPSLGGNSRASTQTSEANSIALGPDDDTPGAGLQFATFGAGCFWGVELAYQRVPGVVKTEVGYTQGRTHNPSYEDACSGRTGHVEALRVEYDPKEVSYEKLLDVLWARHNPTQLNRQGNDMGTQYRSGIYFYTPEQERIAKESVAKEEARIGKKIVTEILPAKKWYKAESYHQQYLAKGGRMGFKQNSAKNCNDPIRCYG